MDERFLSNVFAVPPKSRTKSKKVGTIVILVTNSDLWPTVSRPNFERFFGNPIFFGVPRSRKT